MELVPWVYNNPRVIANHQETRSFLFKSHVVEVLQVVDAEIDAAKNTALKLWDRRILPRHATQTQQSFVIGEGKRCVELGSGCGLVGLVAWICGLDVTLTDLPSAITHTERCVWENVKRLSGDCVALRSRRDDIRVRAYTWGEDTAGLDPPYDVIVASDVVYDPGCAYALVESLERLCGTGTVILLSYKPRGLGEECFFSLLDKKFICNIVSEDFHLAEFLNSDYKIFAIKPKL